MSLISALLTMTVAVLASFMILDLTQQAQTSLRIIESRKQAKNLTTTLQLAWSSAEAQCKKNFIEASGSISGPLNFDLSKMNDLSQMPNYVKNALTESFTNRLPFVAINGDSTNGPFLLPNLGALVGSSGLRLDRILLINPVVKSSTSFSFEVVPVLKNMNTQVFDMNYEDGATATNGLSITFNTDSSGNVTNCQFLTTENNFSIPVEFSSSGGSIWTVPPGIRKIRIEAWGGGGGGGRGGSLPIPSPINVTWGGGGGGGGYVSRIIKVTPGTQLYITVGAGGAGGTSLSGNGQSGQASCVDTSAFNSSCDNSVASTVLIGPGGDGGSETGLMTDTFSGHGGGKVTDNSATNEGSVDWKKFFHAPTAITSPPGDAIYISGGDGARIVPGLKITPPSNPPNPPSNPAYPSPPGGGKGGGQDGGIGGMGPFINTTDAGENGDQPGGGGGPSVSNSANGGNGAAGRVMIWY